MMGRGESRVTSFAAWQPEDARGAITCSAVCAVALGRTKGVSFESVPLVEGR